MTSINELSLYLDNYSTTNSSSTKGNKFPPVSIFNIDTDSSTSKPGDTLEKTIDDTPSLSKHDGEEQIRQREIEEKKREELKREIKAEIAREEAEREAKKLERERESEARVKEFEETEDDLPAMYPEELLWEVKEKGTTEGKIKATKYLIEQKNNRIEELNDLISKLDPKKQEDANEIYACKQEIKEIKEHLKELKKDLKSLGGSEDVEETDETEATQQTKPTNKKTAKNADAAQTKDSKQLDPETLKQIVAAVLEAMGKAPAAGTPEAAAQAEQAAPAETTAQADAVQLDPATMQQIVSAVLAALEQAQTAA